MASIQATFWTFAKRENSTKAPNGGGTTQSIVLKDATDLLNPVIELHLAEAFRYNYCYIDFTGRYYFIKSFDSIAKDTYTLYLECDVLATWISEVRGQSVYAQYCSYNYNEEIDDGRVYPTKKVSVTQVDGGKPDVLSSVPYQFLSLVTNDGLLAGIDIFYVAAASGALTEYIQKLSDLSWWQAVQAYSAGLNAFDALNDLYYLPFLPNFCHDISDSHYASIYNVDIRGRQCIASALPKQHNDNTLDIPRPSVSDFRYTSKYVKYYLQLPYIGVVNVPTELAVGADYIYYDYAADCVTGTFVISPRIRGVNLGIYSANLKASIGIGRQRVNGSPFLTNAVETITGGAMTGAFAGGVAGAAIGAASGAGVAALGTLFNLPVVNKVGGVSGTIAPASLANERNVKLIMAESEASINPTSLATIAGRPSEKIVTISNGFIQTHNASVSFSGSPEEIRQFNSLLNGGIYVE